MNRTRKKLQVSDLDDFKRKSQLAKFEDLVMRDDITVVIAHYKDAPN